MFNNPKGPEFLCKVGFFYTYLELGLFGLVFPIQVPRPKGPSTQ